MKTRLLIVDGSTLAVWLVGQVAPCDVEVVHATTFAQAERILRGDPPDAAIFNVTPCHLEWKDLLDRCRTHDPSIPFLCTSALGESEVDEVDIPCDRARYFSKSLPLSELRSRVEALIELAREGGSDAATTDEVVS